MEKGRSLIPFVSFLVWRTAPGQEGADGVAIHANLFRSFRSAQSMTIVKGIIFQRLSCS